MVIETTQNLVREVVLLCSDSQFFISCAGLCRSQSQQLSQRLYACTLVFWCFRSLSLSVNHWQPVQSVKVLDLRGA